MVATRECDRSGCPAPALRHVEIRGQDFHFCNHHWVELASTALVRAGLADGDSSGELQPSAVDAEHRVRSLR